MHTFLALGDSYTIGEAVPENGRWPNQLVQQLREFRISIADPEIIATTGWTTEELQQAILQKKLGITYSLVSLLIGVNNQFREYPITTYQSEFESLLQQAIAYAGGVPERVIVLSIPDYGVTPFAIDKKPLKIASEIDRYNLISKGLAVKYQVKWFDITAISRKANENLSLTAADGLHPSASMYNLWVAKIFSYVVNLLRND